MTNEMPKFLIECTPHRLRKKRKKGGRKVADVHVPSGHAFDEAQTQARSKKLLHNTLDRLTMTRFKFLKANLSFHELGLIHKICPVKKYAKWYTFVVMKKSVLFSIM